MIKYCECDCCANGACHAVQDCQYAIRIIIVALAAFGASLLLGGILVIISRTMHKRRLRKFLAEHQSDIDTDDMIRSTESLYEKGLDASPTKSDLETQTSRTGRVVSRRVVAASSRRLLELEDAAAAKTFSVMVNGKPARFSRYTLEPDEYSEDQTSNSPRNRRPEERDEEFDMLLRQRTRSREDSYRRVGQIYLANPMHK